jgi:hypothetical protein
VGNNTRHDPEHQKREAEQERQFRAKAHLKAELTTALMTALSQGPDAIYLVQRAAGHDLVRMGLLHPDLRFVSSTGEPADRIVEVPVEVASTEPFDPHEIGTVDLLRLVRTRLWEDNRIEQGERVNLIALTNDVMARLGSMAGK